jgi:hypothetical protein
VVHTGRAEGPTRAHSTWKHSKHARRQCLHGQIERQLAAVVAIRSTALPGASRLRVRVETAGCPVAVGAMRECEDARRYVCTCTDMQRPPHTAETLSRTVEHGVDVRRRLHAAPGAARRRAVACKTLSLSSPARQRTQRRAGTAAAAERRPRQD